MHEKVIYLDFDGVLHPDEAYQDDKGRVYLRGPGKLFEYAPVLVEALALYPDLRIVLSTSWVRMKSYSWVCRHLPEGLRKRVIGATWHSRFKHDYDETLWWRDASRYRQIKRDLLRRMPAYWLAIDDDMEGWPENEMDRVVYCDPENALGGEQAQALLIDRLKAMS
ncbi:HAD domain-containing protein [Rhodanobacter sp. BL-MT-08]